MTINYYSNVILIDVTIVIYLFGTKI